MKTYSVGPGAERVRRIPCPLCTAAADRNFLQNEEYQFVRCQVCGLVFQNPQPIFDDLQHRYAEAYYQYELENEDNFFNLMKLGLKDIRFEGFTFPPDRRFLDVGCATGRLLEHMSQQGWSVNGVELCPPSAEHARKRGLDVFTGTLEQASFAPESFTVIHFSHLIEHVLEPKRFMAEVHRLLHPQGMVVVTTPNVKGLQARILKNRWRSAIADHLVLFSKSTLKRLLNESGLSVREVKTWGGIARGLAPSWIKNPLDRLAKRLGFGDVILMLAVKVRPV